MKKFGVLLLIATLLFVEVAPAAAHHGGPRFHGYVFVDALLAPLFLPFAVAATITTGIAAAVTAPFTYPYAPYSPAYAPPVHAAPSAPAPAYAPPVYAAPPSAAAPAYAPPVYAAPSAPAPAYGPPAYAAPPPPRPAPAYWYYCQSAGRYYPYVNACPVGWVTVAPR
jgi:hypothetical protein